MSQENVEVVRQGVDAWNRRDEDKLLALVGAEAEFVNAPDAVEPGTRRETTELMTVWRTQWEILRDGHMDIDRVFDREDEIFVLGRVSRRMPEGEARIGDQFLSSWSVRDGKAVRVAMLGFGKTDVEKALEAAGLRD